MNELYIKQEEDLKKKKLELETKKHLMAKEMERCSRKKQDASWRRYHGAQKKVKETESKNMDFHDNWCMSVRLWHLPWSSRTILIQHDKDS